MPGHRTGCQVDYVLYVHHLSRLGSVFKIWHQRHGKGLQRLDLLCLLSTAGVAAWSLSVSAAGGVVVNTVKGTWRVNFSWTV